MGYISEMFADPVGCRKKAKKGGMSEVLGQNPRKSVKEHFEAAFPHYRKDKTKE